MSVQNTEQTPYDQQVRRIAEILAISEYKERTTAFYDGNTWEGLDDHGKELHVLSQVNTAKLMVAEIDKALINYFEETVLPGVPDRDNMKGWAIIQFEAYRENLGFIPPTKTKDDDK